MEKIIIMDLDGSILNPDGSIPENLQQLIKRSKNNYWSICTGRSYATTVMTGISKQIPMHALHVFDGGGLISSLSGHIYKTYFLSEKDKDSFINFFNANIDLIEYVFSSCDLTGGVVYSKISNLDFPAIGYVSNLSDYASLIYGNKLTKISIRMKNEFDRNNFSMAGCNFNISTKNIDITSINTNKGSAVCEVLKNLNYKSEDVIFVFNDYNDLPVINHPDLSDITKIRVGNSVDIASEYSVDSQDDVAEILSLLI